MNGRDLEYEKTIVAEAVTDNRIKNTGARSSEWVTAANARVRRDADVSAKPRPSQTMAEITQKPKQKRDVLAEFSKPDTYTKEKNKNFNAINEEDTEYMTAQRKRVTPSEIEQRMRRTSQAIPQKRPVPQNSVQDSRPTRNVNPTHKNSEWTSVKNVTQSDTRTATGAPRPMHRPERIPQESRAAQKRAPAQAPRANDTRAKFAPTEKKKRVFTPIEAEEVILLKGYPQKHKASPYTGLFLAIVALMSIITVILCIGMSTKITRINVKSEDTAGINAEITAICDDLLGRSYLTFNEDKITDRIKEVTALVEGVELTGSFPRGLNVFVTYDTERYYAEDESGKIYVTNSSLKVLHIYESKESSTLDGLTKLALPSFTVDKVGQTLKFTGTAAYVKAVAAALASYDGLGHISYVSFANTQRIYFIFEENYRCDLGDASELELKLKSAESTYKEGVIPALAGNTERTAVINVSVPSSATCRLDADLGITD